MRTPTSAGQFRYVRYSGDGCGIYACCWCDRTIEIRDNPEWAGWNFCPKCGKSWFTKLQCRPHNTPRWYWDRWGDDPTAETVNTFSGELQVSDLRWNSRPKPQWEWVIEERVQWEGEPWKEWSYQTSHPVEVGELGSWQMVKSRLECYRGRVSDRPTLVKFEYRARVQHV